MLNKTKPIRIHTFKNDFYSNGINDDLVVDAYDIKEEIIQINGFYYDCHSDETLYNILNELHGSCCTNLEKVHKRNLVVFIISINDEKIEIDFDDEFVFSLFEYEPYEC
tara:strand:- start:17 stop:343 length:327 start_codon:yes stop_codon:yes gene_type:complete